jgi:hypothetical protein
VSFAPAPWISTTGSRQSSIFFRDGVEEILNLQPRGSNSKPYQEKQVREVIVKNKLAEEEL